MSYSLIEIIDNFVGINEASSIIPVTVILVCDQCYQIIDPNLKF